MSRKRRSRISTDEIMALALLMFANTMGIAVILAVLMQY
jgi:hypothetical protein